MEVLRMTPRLEPFGMAWKVNKALIVIFMVELSANFSEYFFTILLTAKNCKVNTEEVNEITIETRP